MAFTGHAFGLANPTFWQLLAVAVGSLDPSRILCRGLREVEFLEHGVYSGVVEDFVLKLVVDH